MLSVFSEHRILTIFMKPSELKTKLIVNCTIMSGCATIALLLRFAAIDEFGIGPTLGNIVFGTGLIVFIILYHALSLKRHTLLKNETVSTR